MAEAVSVPLPRLMILQSERFLSNSGVKQTGYSYVYRVKCEQQARCTLDRARSGRYNVFGALETQARHPPHHTLLLPMYAAACATMTRDQSASGRDDDDESLY